MFTAMMTLALTCHLSKMVPDFYTATLEGPTQDKTYKMVLTSEYFGAQLKSTYILKNTMFGLFGTNDKGDTALLHTYQRDTRGTSSFTIASSKDGYLDMVCTDK